MQKIKLKILGILIITFGIFSCSDKENINTNPTPTSEIKPKVEPTKSAEIKFTDDRKGLQLFPKSEVVLKTNSTATLRFTIDGSEVTSKSKKYEKAFSPFTLTQDKNIILKVAFDYKNKILFKTERKIYKVTKTFKTVDALRKEILKENKGQSDYNYIGLEKELTSLYGLFSGSNFNADISIWDTSYVTNMNFMFDRAKEFNHPLGNWDTSNVTDMSSMFQGSEKFNQAIGNWDTSNVTDMSRMFSSAQKFNQPIGNWNTSRVENISYMFAYNREFNQPIGNWDTSNVKVMENVFSTATKFNQPIGKWNTSNVINMYGMFNSAEKFNHPIGNWDTSKVTTIRDMFSYTKVFNQDISKWDVSKVTDMSWTFFRAEKFNQPIGNWVTSSVTNMSIMFTEAKEFNQDISSWNVDKVTRKAEFADDSGFKDTPSKWPQFN